MSKATILVVEDDAHLLEGIQDILKLEGYSVLTALNGSDALEILQRQSRPPDLIVSDIMMPKMDGFQFLREVRKNDQWLAVPFIFLTAKGEKTDQHHGMRLGVDDYVVKPYDPKDLLVKIETRLARHRALNQAHQTGMANLKRQILTMLNHEFRTPLTFVVAYADMLSNPGTHKLSDVELARYLQGISIGAERLRKLIENFILLVELETGDAEKTYQWRQAPIGDIPEVLRAACERAKELKDHPVTLEIEGDLPIVRGDSEYLICALTQLLTNAAKFSPPDAPIKIGAFADDEQVTLWVQDVGRGIPKSEQGRIWEAFYQINRAVNEDQGAGSGLAIVERIAKLHAGSVGIESEEGMGSVFKIILPIAKIAA